MEAVAEAAALAVADDSIEDAFPVGVRFAPTDVELLEYLTCKVRGEPLPCSIVKDINCYDHPPWQLKMMCGLKRVRECYFFTMRDKKYPNGSRPNRVTNNFDGYWKTTTKDTEIKEADGKKLKGVRNALKFFTGKASRGTKTDWIIQEYRLTDPELKQDLATSDNPMRLDWVICKLYDLQGKKRTEAVKRAEVAEQVAEVGALAAVEQVEERPLIVGGDALAIEPWDIDAPPPSNVVGIINGDFNDGNGRDKEIEAMLRDIVPPCDFIDGIFNHGYEGTVLSQPEELPCTTLAEVLAVTSEQVSATLPPTSSDFNAQMGILHGAPMPQLVDSSSHMHAQTGFLQSAATTLGIEAMLRDIVPPCDFIDGIFNHGCEGTVLSQPGELPCTTLAEVLAVTSEQVSATLPPTSDFNAQMGILHGAPTPQLVDSSSHMHAQPAFLQSAATTPHPHYIYPRPISSRPLLTPPNGSYGHRLSNYATTAGTDWSLPKYGGHTCNN